MRRRIRSTSQPLRMKDDFTFFVWTLSQTSGPPGQRFVHVLLLPPPGWRLVGVGAKAPWCTDDDETNKLELSEAIAALVAGHRGFARILVDAT
jgi:hypothetical protein